MSISTFDLSSNDRGYGLILLGTIRRVMATKRIQFLLSDTHCLLKLYQRFSVNPFLLKVNEIAGSETSKFLVEFSSTVQKVLIINKHRCPGPIAEILAALQAISASESLELIIFDNKVDLRSISNNLKQRGYLLTELLQIGAHFSKITISVNSDV